MNSENQFKRDMILLILFVALVYGLHSVDFSKYTKSLKFNMPQKVAVNNDAEVNVKDEEESFLTKLWRASNPKQYWISGKIKINTLSNYNNKTKDEIYTFRKYYVNKTIFKDKNYLPNQEVFGSFKEKAPWLGVKAFSCIGPNTLSYRSMSKESKFINNPDVLIGIDYATFPKQTTRCSEEDYLIPKVLSFSKDKNSFELTYQVPEEQKERMFKLIGLNARDLGFKYGFCRKTNNIEFATSIDNISKNIYQFKDAIRPDASCGVKGGCNNNLAYQEELFFNIKNSPATFELKLWKEKPEVITAPADINFTIILE